LDKAYSYLNKKGKTGAAMPMKAQDTPARHFFRIIFEVFGVLVIIGIALAPV